MIRLYITSHACGPNAVSADRYWLADDQTSRLSHLGVWGVDRAFVKTLVHQLGAKVIELDIPDDSFKKLMIEEGYEQ